MYAFVDKASWLVPVADPSAPLLASWLVTFQPQSHQGKGEQGRDIFVSLRLSGLSPSSRLLVLHDRYSFFPSNTSARPDDRHPETVCYASIMAPDGQRLDFGGYLSTGVTPLFSYNKGIRSYFGGGVKNGGGTYYELWKSKWSSHQFLLNARIPILSACNDS